MRSRSAELSRREVKPDLRERGYGEEPADAEVRGIIARAFERTVTLLTETRELLDRSARERPRKGTLDQKDTRRVTRVGTNSNSSKTRAFHQHECLFGSA